MIGSWMLGTNLRHSLTIGSRDVVQPVVLQQHTRALLGASGLPEHVVDAAARRPCALDASKLGPAGLVVWVVFHGHTNACAPSSILMRSRRYGSSTARREGRWHGLRPRAGEHASSHDWPKPARNQPESRPDARCAVRTSARTCRMVWQVRKRCMCAGESKNVRCCAARVT